MWPPEAIDFLTSTTSSCTRARDRACERRRARADRARGEARPEGLLARSSEDRAAPDEATDPVRPPRARPLAPHTGLRQAHQDAVRRREAIRDLDQQARRPVD